MIDRVLLALLGGSILCGALVVAELRQGGGSASALAPRAATEAKIPAANRPKSPPSGDLVAASLARPLFSSTRRPAAHANTAPPAGPDTAKLRLTGIVMEADRHVAIFAAEGRRPFVRAEGETINQWYLDQILPQQVVLSGPDGSLTMEMRGDPALTRSATQTPRMERAGNASPKPAPNATEATAAARPAPPAPVQSQENVPRGSSPAAVAPPRPAASTRNRTAGGSSPTRASDPPRPQP
jgi:hypothetical protein